jgi:hypothetical protein
MSHALAWVPVVTYAQQLLEQGLLLGCTQLLYMKQHGFSRSFMKFQGISRFSGFTGFRGISRNFYTFRQMYRDFTTFSRNIFSIDSRNFNDFHGISRSFTVFQEFPGIFTEFDEISRSFMGFHESRHFYFINSSHNCSSSHGCWHPWNFNAYLTI